MSAVQTASTAQRSPLRPCSFTSNPVAVLRISRLVVRKPRGFYTASASSRHCDASNKRRCLAGTEICSPHARATFARIAALHLLPSAQREPADNQQQQPERRECPILQRGYFGRRCRKACYA